MDYSRVRLFAFESPCEPERGRPERGSLEVLKDVGGYSETGGRNGWRDKDGEETCWVTNEGRERGSGHWRWRVWGGISRGVENGNLCDRCGEPGEPGHVQHSLDPG